MIFYAPKFATKLAQIEGKKIPVCSGIRLWNRDNKRERERADAGMKKKQKEMRERPLK